MQTQIYQKIRRIPSEKSCLCGSFKTSRCRQYWQQKRFLQTYSLVDLTTADETLAKTMLKVYARFEEKQTPELDSLKKEGCPFADIIKQM